MKSSQIALVLSFAALAQAQAAPIVEQLTGETHIDYSHGCILVAAQAVPSLYLPSAKVARSEAEQKARRAAAHRLRQALAALPRERLGCHDPDTLPAVDQAAAQAPTQQIDWGSDGSVRLVLAVPLVALTGRGGSATKSAGTGPAAVAVVLLDPGARPALFGPGPCATATPAPPLFETLADATEALPQIAKARVVPAGKPAAAAGATVLAIIVEGKLKPEPNGKRSHP